MLEVWKYEILVAQFRYTGFRLRSENISYLFSPKNNNLRKLKLQERIFLDHSIPVYIYGIYIGMYMSVGTIN